MLIDKLSRRIAQYTNRKLVRLPEKRAIVSFSFDDVPHSACTLGAEIVASTGGHATYFISGYCEAAEPYFYTCEDLIRLHAAGHEIGSHSFGHLSLHKVSSATLAADLARNSDFIESLGIPAPRIFSYPWGHVSPATKRLCNRKFEMARGVTGGINRGVADFGFLKAIPLYSQSLSVEKLESLFHDLRNHGGWLVFLSHAVTPQPEQYDTSPNLLNRAVTLAESLGIPSLTMSEAANSLRGSR